LLCAHSEESEDLPRSSDRPATEQRMAAVHALGHPSSPTPQTAWEPSKLIRGGGATNSAITPAGMPPNMPGVPVLERGTGSDLIVRWTAPTADPAHGLATGFALRHGPAGSGTWTVVPGVAHPYELSDLPSDAAIDVQLQATNMAGVSRWSATATLTTGVSGSVACSPAATICLRPGRPAATDWRMLCVQGCRIARLTQLLSWLIRRLGTQFWRAVRWPHLSRASSRKRRNP
jgi:hypothetical protein